MTAPAAFAAERYDLPPSGTSQLILQTGVEADAERLGTAFASIDPWARYPYPAPALAAYFAGDEPGAPRFSIRLGDEVAGVVGLRLNWLRGPYVQFLGILPAFQGFGLGAAVLDWIEQEAQRVAERNIWVMVSDFNAGAIRFYNRNGFSEASRFPDLVRDGRVEVLLRKQLAHIL